MRRMRPAHYDADYKRRISEAVLEAVMTTSLVDQPDGTKAAMIRSGEVFDALLELSAFFVAGAESLNSPSKVREFTQTEAKRLQRLIAAARDKAADRSDIFHDLPDSYDD